MTKRILIAGFGGQGVLFAGKVLATAGLILDTQVSWLPSYGPEMRGGTANCSVILSDTVIGSPIVNTPDILIAMNLPSLDKYEDSLPAGATLIYDSSLISRPVKRTDISAYAVPATALADEKELSTLGNMILLGQMLAKTDVVSLEVIEAALRSVVSAKHADLLDKNLQAIRLGYGL